MKGKISDSPSMASTTTTSTMTATTTTTTTTTTTEDSERRDSNCYFPDCRKDANCSCEICLDSLNATLDLMPLSVQKSSLTKLSFASSFKPTVESTPTSFDPSVEVATPASVSRPILKVMMISSPKKKQIKKPIVSEDKEEPRKEERKSLLLCLVLLKVVFLIGLALCLELGFRWVREEGVLKPEFTEEIVRNNAGERSQGGLLDLGVKLRLFEDGLIKMGFANSGKISSCRGSDSKWQINQNGPMLISKCVVYKSAIEEVSIWGWPLQTAGLYRTGFSSSSITVLSGRVTEWTDGKFGYTIHNTNESWGKTKWSTSVLQLDPNTWVLEYSQSSVMDGSSLLSLTMDLLKHIMFQAAKNVNREVFWMFSGCFQEATETKDTRTMTPT